MWRRSPYETHAVTMCDVSMGVVSQGGGKAKADSPCDLGGKACYEFMWLG